MTRLLPLVLLLTATPAFAQTPAPAPQSPPAAAPDMSAAAPPPAFIAAAQAFGQCMKQAGAAVPATATPEDGATQVIAMCATQRTALDTGFTTWVNGPGFPEAGRAMALQQFRAEMDKLPLEVADSIRKARATPTPAPTPAPAK